MSKKDKTKEKMSDALAEGIVELILTIIVGGIGVVICLGVSKLFHFKINEIDPDLFVIIGCAALLVIIVVFASIITLIKKVKNNTNKPQKSIEDSTKS